MTASASTWTSPLLDLLFDEPSVGRCLVAPDGSVLRVNGEWLRSTCFALDDVLGADVVGLFPGTRDMALALHARARAGHHVEVPLHAQRVDGRETWWQGSIDPVPMEGGTGLLITAREVPEPRRRDDGAPRAAPILDELYRAAFEHALDGALLTKPDGTILRVNAAACRAFGLSEAEICRLGREARVVDDARVRALLAEREWSGAASGEITLRRGDGTTFPAEISSSVILARDGERYTSIVFRDVTAQRHAQQALRESEEKLRLLAQAMPQIVCVLAPDGTPEYVNPSWTAFSGLDLAATVAATWAGFVHRDDVPAALENRRRVLKTLAPHDVELRYRAADGSFRWFLSRLAPVVEGGRAVRLVGAAMDIEARKRGEAALREQLALKDQLAKVAASVPGVICSFRLRPDGSACMPFSAPAIADLYGIAQDVLARDMAPAFARTNPDDRRRILEDVEASARTLSRWSALFRYEHPTKGLRWIEGTSIPAREPDGSVLWHGYVADVTNRIRAEEALRDSVQALRETDRRKNEFLGMLSHELRNPLAPIRTALYLLDRADPGGAQARRAREIANRQVAHLTRLVDDLLDVTRIARGKIALRRADLDLGALARRTAEDHRALMQQRALELSVEVPPDPVAVNGDETRLAQILGNLLANAAKFTPPGGRVALWVGVDGPSAVVRVRDTGPGIEPAMLESIFDPFTQAQQTLARSDGGLGLGLALVKGLVALHRGQVHARSAGAGCGAEFVVRLPLAARARPSGAGAERAGDARAPTRRRVLVVDDNRDAADMLAQLVELLGHDAIVAYDGASALAVARSAAPDVVLCDIGLPGLDGHAVARELRARGGADLRLYAVSGYAQPEDVSRAIEAGFDGHVAKPPDPARIEALLR